MAQSVATMIDERLKPSRWLPAFLDFVSKVRVTSKETTEPQPLELYEAQLRLLGEIFSGLDDNIHHFVCLKARQLGCSTVMYLLDIFWLSMYPGLQGALIMDTSDNKEIARQTLTQILEDLPDGYRVPIKKHNRVALILANGSRLQYMSAGIKKNASLARSRGLNFVHASETSHWGDEDGVESLVRSLAEENPNRLYVFESTANGFNLFQRMYARAKSNPAQKAFFIGWWAKESYRFKRGSREFERWWSTNPSLTDMERAKCAIVREKFSVEIDEEQLAWYRAQLFEKSEAIISQELPWDETEAFQATGSPYFSQKRITADLNVIAGKLGFKGYRYHLGSNFLDTRFQKCDDLREVELRIWEEPKGPARYVIGVDPAFGRSELADRSVVSVWRCFSDKLIQCAEYATAAPEARQVAWILAHLAGCYRDCIINLETNGPGALVMQELRHLRDQMTIGPLRGPAQSLDVAESLNNARWFLWSRTDVLSPTYQYNTKTTAQEKSRVYGSFRDEYNSEAAVVRSVPLLEEMQTLRQDGLKIEASGKHKDDRVMAAALANISWVTWIRTKMMSEQRTYVREMTLEAEYEKRGSDVNNHIVANFFEMKKQERDARMWQATLEN